MLLLDRARAANTDELIDALFIRDRFAQVFIKLFARAADAQNGHWIDNRSRQRIGGRWASGQRVKSSLIVMRPRERFQIDQTVQRFPPCADRSGRTRLCTMRAQTPFCRAYGGNRTGYRSRFARQPPLQNPGPRASASEMSASVASS